MSILIGVAGKWKLLTVAGLLDTGAVGERCEAVPGLTAPPAGRCQCQNGAAHRGSPTTSLRFFVPCCILRATLGLREAYAYARKRGGILGRDVGRRAGRCTARGGARDGGRAVENGADVDRHRGPLTL